MECLFAALVIFAIIGFFSDRDTYDGVPEFQMGGFELRLRSSRMTEEPHLDLKAVEARGLFPVRRAIEGGVLITASIQPMTTLSRYLPSLRHCRKKTP